MSAEPTALRHGGDAAALEEQIEELQLRVRQAEERRRALIHIMGDLNESNRRLGDQRKAMLHILKDSHRSNLKLEDSRKAMIHIMGDLRSTTQVMERREQELRDKQEQLRLRAIDVDLDLCPDALIVQGNPIQLEQVFINLLTNARDALSEVPEARKKIRIVSSLERDRIRIVFQDTGPGIPAEIAKRVFDPFFTTKEVGTGTGLGLSITYSIVKEHGGDISLSKTPGGGATFTVEVPVYGDAAEELLR